MRCESSLGWKCCIGLTETVALISNRFNGLAQATPRFNRLAELAACVPLAPMPCGNQLEVEETSRVQLQSEYCYLSYYQ